MQIDIMVKKTVEVKYFKAVMGVRYFEDAEVNGEEEDDDYPQMPLINDNTWTITIDLDTGKILNWPVGTTAKTYYKVCDDGEYFLTDKDFNVLISKSGCYVPKALSPEINGYGDYVILNILEDGTISGWNKHLLKDFVKEIEEKC